MTYFISSTLAHGSTVNSSWQVTVPLKSRFDGDKNEIRTIQARVLSALTNSVSSFEGEHDVGTQNILLYPRNRPILMHCTEGGLTLNGGSIKFDADDTFTDAQVASTKSVIGSVTMLVKPTSATFTIAAGTATATISTTGISSTVANSGTTTYINGAAWSGTQKFPFPRLVTVTFGSVRAAPLVITGSGVLSNVSITQSVMTANDVELQAKIAYRKPDSSQVVTDTLASFAISDNAVTIPDTWTELTVS
jgi:hypothetical protein